MKNLSLFKKIKKDFLEMKDEPLFTAVKHFNTINNILYFEKKGVDTLEVMNFCIDLLLEKKMRLPVHGYYNLIKVMRKMR